MLACLLLAACRWSQAEALTVYRCVAADGSVALQDRPCPAGSEQERARYRSPAPLAAPAASTEPGLPPAAAAQPSEAPPPAPSPEPPAVWECVRHDGSRYESDTGIPERRWVPLWVLGLDPRAPPTLFGTPGAAAPEPSDGGPAAPAHPPGLIALGPGAWVSDRCLRLSPAEACARHRERRDALRHRWRLAMPSERDRIRPQARALSAMLRERCGTW